MEFLRKIIFILIGINIAIAKRRYYNHDSHNTFHVPWGFNYPPPVISIDGIWPFGLNTDVYQYQPQHEHYPDIEEPHYNQEMLIKCLNTALTKLNKLLPTKNVETTTYPSAAKPEELAKAVNHAIDRLDVHLSQKNVEVTSTEAPKTTESATTVNEDLNELFTSIPEEVTKNPIVLTNKNKPDLMEESPFVSPILSPEFKPILSQESTTINNLFTSHIVERNKDVTSKPFLSEENLGNVVTTETSDLSTITTEIELETTTVKNDTTEVPNLDIRFGEQKSDFIFPDQFEQLNQNKNPQDVELETRFEKKPVLNQSPQIVLEYKPSRPPFHPDVFPPHPTARPTTQNDLEVDENKPQTPNPFITNIPTTLQTQTPIVLGFKPSRPPFHADIFPPNPTPRPDNNAPTISSDVVDRNKVPQTTTVANEYHPTHYYSTPISLEYKPTRPFYAPNPIVYPKPMIPPGTPWPAKSTERPAN